MKKNFLFIIFLFINFFIFFSFIFLESKTYVVKEYIPFEIKERKSKFIQKGWKIWIKEGEKGFKNVVKTDLIFLGRKIKEKENFKTDVLKKPEEAILISGISENKNPITVPEETYVHFVHTMEATAYDPSPESSNINWAGITKLGWRARYGIAAVDPSVIALRSLLYIDGYGFAWAGDTGSDIKGKRIDLCYNTTKEALKWGRKKVKVYVLGKKPLSHYKKEKR